MGLRSLAIRSENTFQTKSDNSIVARVRPFPPKKLIQGIEKNRTAIRIPDEKVYTKKNMQTKLGIFRLDFGVKEPRPSENVQDEKKIATATPQRASSREGAACVWLFEVTISTTRPRWGGGGGGGSFVAIFFQRSTTSLARVSLLGLRVE